MSDLRRERGGREMVTADEEKFLYKTTEQI